MGILVEVDMYSGLPNPRYELDDAAEKQLLAALAAGRSNATERLADVSGRLGYRGLRLYSIGQISLDPMHVFDGVIESAGGPAASIGFIDVDAEFETLVLFLVKPALRPEEFSYIQEEITKNATGGVEKAGDDYVLETIPAYEPNRWNDDLTVRQSNNCYNYANDKVTNTFAQPGRGSGFPAPYLPTCGDTGAAAASDGQLHIPNSDLSPAEGHIIALVTTAAGAASDFHWYRRDASGNWSHKPGSTDVRNTDNAGRPITDPEHCDRGPYINFCGYFHCIPANVRIR